MAPAMPPAAASLMEKRSKAIEIAEERSPASIVLLVLTAVVAVAVPILLLVRFHKHPMSQVWILSVSICSYVFLLLHLCPTTRRWFFTDFARLSYGLLLAYFSAIVISSAAVTFVLFLSTAWAAGYGGYSLALHRLRKGTEPAIHASSPSCPNSECVKRLNFKLYIGEPIFVLLWTLFMALYFYVTDLPDELDIFMTLLYFGCIHVSCWVMFVALVPMHGVLIAEWSEWLVATLVLWMTTISPVIYIVSRIITVLSYLLLMVALVAFLWYNLAIYMHFLATATPSVSADRLNIGYGENLPGDLPGEETHLIKAADNREIQDQLQQKTSESMDEQLSQALQAKDSLSNKTVMQKSSGVNNGAQQSSDKEKTVPREIFVESLQNKQEAADNREIQDQLQQKISECMDEQLSQPRQAKDSLSNRTVMQKSSGVNNGAQQSSDKEKIVPTEIFAESLQNKQEASLLLEDLSWHLGNMETQMGYIVERLSEFKV